MEFYCSSKQCVLCDIVAQTKRIHGEFNESWMSKMKKKGDEEVKLDVNFYERNWNVHVLT